MNYFYNQWKLVEEAIDGIFGLKDLNQVSISSEQVYLISKKICLAGHSSDFASSIEAKITKIIINKLDAL